MNLDEALAVYLYGQFSRTTRDEETFQEAWRVICEEAQYVIKRENGNNNG